MVATLAALMVLSVGVASARSRTFSKTVSNTKTITIPQDGGLLPVYADLNAKPYPSQIQVTLRKAIRRAKVTDVNLRLNGFSHTYPDDVDILLAHGRKNATIFSDVGRSFDATNLTITLDQQASTPLPNDIQLTSGTFLPTDVEDPDPDQGADNFPFPAPVDSGQTSLSVFKGTKARGSWKLFITDDVGRGDGGQISGGWTLQIKAKVPRS